ncbi:MAG TPA: M20/M25/M40 family metallo-hydrolase, partial [Bacteroidales bacterium]|nr:M20/M25/M40 family metallo-hydrolase [Bacteroidales bacterium]
MKDLRPGPLWMYFEEICRIPRISRNEEKIRQYLLDFAAKHNLESKEDSTGNILITKKAAPGFEKVKPLVLQSHMDMVGEKNADHPHNWKTDPITPVIRNGWVSASGTTLGADDGVGIAAQLAVLTDEKIHAGEIECLFTVDEESGMTGAVNLQPEFIKGRTLLNLDSEDEGILYIGCAGGMDTVGTIRYNPVPVSSDDIAVELSVTGLRGGHSGDEIHKGLGNAVKIMNGLLRELSANTGARLSHINAGNLRNAIAREA